MDSGPQERNKLGVKCYRKKSNTPKSSDQMTAKKKDRE